MDGDPAYGYLEIVEKYAEPVSAIFRSDEPIPGEAAHPFRQFVSRVPFSGSLPS